MTASRCPNPWFALVLVLVLVLVAGACGGQGAVEPARPGQRPQTRGPAEDPAGPGAGTIPTGTAPIGGEPTQLNPGAALVVGTPVYDGDFADPYVLVVGDTTYAYATNTDDANLPVIVSDGGDEGTYHGDAFPTLPSWSAPGRVWAPAVYAQDDGYIAYYTTVENESGKQCVSRAVAPTPVGPFVDDSTDAMVCQLDLGGTIDPSVVTHDGRAWLLFKNDGNCCGVPTSLWSQELSADGLDVVGEATRLIGADQWWEGGLVEAPSMVEAAGTWYLFYSANAWDSARYAIGFARCESVTGPCTKAPGPWMISTAFASGPGGQEFFAKDDQVWMVYHGWQWGEVGYPQGERRLYLDLLEVVDGVPVHVGGGVSLVLVGSLIGAGVAVVVLLGFLLVRRRRARHPTAEA